MRTHSSTNIKDILKNEPHNTVITAEEMVRQNVSREQIRSFAKLGWLKRIGIGAYSLLDETISIDGALYTLQKQVGLSIHEGAYSVLNEKYGKTHNISYFRKQQLFLYRGEKIPAWFKTNYGSNYELFYTSFLPKDLGLAEYDTGNFSIKIPTSERAILEMLYLTPEVHTVQEAFQVMELLVAFKPKIVQELLENCSMVKVKRLFLYMAELAGHSWFKRLDVSKIDLGSGVREIEKGGAYEKKYQIIITDVKSI